MTTIGVTGHRILAEVEKIESAVDEAIRRVEQAFPSSTLRVLSALAEGSDRLVARRVLARPGGRLVASLPMSKADYMNDFAKPESRREFLDLLAQAEEAIELPAAASRDAAYEAAGLYVLEHSDVLIAIWDGKSSQGRGGTGAIVAEARERAMPVVWVHAGNRQPKTLEPTSLGEEQGKLTFENL
jgi:hypothetical protein